jgi:hypothetical protein
MIDQMSSAAFLATSLVMATIAIVIAVGIYSIGKKMVSIPNEKIIQINLDVRFIPLAINGVLLFIFGNTSFYGFQKYQEQRFMETEGVEEIGWIGGGHLKEMLEAREGGNCSHVIRDGDYPMVIATSASETPSVICGTSHEALNSAGLLPYIKKDGQYTVLLGKWPWERKISYKAS